MIPTATLPSSSPPASLRNTPSIQQPSVTSTLDTIHTQKLETSLSDGEASKRDSYHKHDEKITEKSSQDEDSHEKVVDTVQSRNVQGDDDFPDGGLRAWLVVFGSMCNAFSTFGYVNSWGVFQAYYQDTLLKDLSPSSIAWIGSMQYALIFLPGIVIGRLFDLGYYPIIAACSSIVLVLATFLTGQCTEYWQFLLAQGIAVGLACGGVFGPTNAILAHWFKKRRGLALGYMAVGSSVGGTTLPIATRSLIPRVGFPWTMRIIGFILLVTLTLSNLTLKRRLPPVNVKGGLFNFAAFKEIPYTIYCLSSFINFLGLYTVLTYVNVSATQLGSSSNLSTYFVSFANASSLLGRWAAGILSDRIGPMNVMIPFTLLAGILTCVWPFTRSTASLIVTTVIYGFCSGTYVTLMTNPLMELGGEGDVGRRLGMFMSITAIGALLGPPISGAINARTGGFEAVGLYAGCAVMVAVACMILVRYIVLGRWIGKL